MKSWLFVLGSSFIKLLTFNLWVQWFIMDSYWYHRTCCRFSLLCTKSLWWWWHIYSHDLGKITAIINYYTGPKQVNSSSISVCLIIVNCSGLQHKSTTLKLSPISPISYHVMVNIISWNRNRLSSNSGSDATILLSCIVCKCAVANDYIATFISKQGSPKA